MILELLESRRARRFAGGALAASVAVHLSFAGVAARPPVARAADAPEPISIRYLLPPDQAPSAPVERLTWVGLGSRPNGWDAGLLEKNAALPARGGDEVALATHIPDVSDLAGNVLSADVVYQEYEVDSAVTRDPASGGPEYPNELRLRGVQGDVLVEFAVDTTGHADSATFVVVQASHPEFAHAVRAALPRMLFTPAIARGRRVRQLVRLPMKFKLLTETAQGTT